MELFEIQVNHRGDIEGNELGDHQAADNHKSERPARCAVGAESQRDRQRAENRREGRHQDRAEAVHTGIVNRFIGGLAGFHPLKSEIDDHDAVLFDDPHQHEQADKCIKRRLLAEQIESQESAHESRGEC